MQRALPKLRAAGIKLYVVSYDEREALADFSRAHGIEFPMLSDVGSRVIRQYGILNTQVPKHQAPFYGIPFPGSLPAQHRSAPMVSKHDAIFGRLSEGRRADAQGHASERQASRRPPHARPSGPRTNSSRSHASPPLGRRIRSPHMGVNWGIPDQPDRAPSADGGACASLGINAQARRAAPVLWTSNGRRSMNRRRSASGRKIRRRSMPPQQERRNSRNSGHP